ncbi:hypothetical protein BDZ91DRAFT_638768, partial [Kalaharituber pfeilii]
FTLYAHITLVSGDQPAREKLMNHYGSSGSRYCTYCYAHGCYKAHIYCPFNPPTNPPPTATNQAHWRIYDPANLPMRKDEEWRYDAIHITQTMNFKRAEELGIHGQCILMRLTSIDFPRSFVLDSMHLFYINVIPAIFNHFRGKFFPLNSLSNDSTSTDAAATPVIGSDMSSSTQKYPADFGDQIRSIKEFCHQYKAHEWVVWAHVFLIIYLNDPALPKKYYHAYLGLVRAIHFCRLDEITKADLQLTEKLLFAFIQHYE